MTYRLVGHLRATEISGVIAGELRCPTFGTTFVLTGTREAGGYRLAAVPGPIPEGLKLPWDDNGDD